ncbi:MULTISPECIES: J domain-containing protein [Aerosakkonema]|uniref:J domain-containing protein n=1 Tax=Aerosakkonema TaxID=1246629 RepID=UPI0035B9D0E7
MTSNRATHNQENRQFSTRIPLSSSYYALLGLHPSASAVEIRRAYRELSKRYHPDTTELPEAIATTKFQQLNEAYATLSNPERRLHYDTKIGYSRVTVIQPPADLNRPVSDKGYESSSAYLDPTDRPLSPGEIFALFIMLVTFVGCLLLAIAIGLTQPVSPSNQTVQQQVSPSNPTTEKSIRSPELKI